MACPACTQLLQDEIHTVALACSVALALVCHIGTAAQIHHAVLQRRFFIGNGRGDVLVGHDKEHPSLGVDGRVLRRGVYCSLHGKFVIPFGSVGQQINILARIGFIYPVFALPVAGHGGGDAVVDGDGVLLHRRVGKDDRQLPHGIIDALRLGEAERELTGRAAQAVCFEQAVVVFDSFDVIGAVAVYIKSRHRLAELRVPIGTLRFGQLHENEADTVGLAAVVVRNRIAEGVGKIMRAAAQIHHAVHLLGGRIGDVHGHVIVGHDEKLLRLALDDHFVRRIVEGVGEHIAVVGDVFGADGQPDLFARLGFGERMVVFGQVFRSCRHTAVHNDAVRLSRQIDRRGDNVQIAV